MSEAAFTIVNGAYLAFALTLAESFKNNNPHREFYVFLLDNLPSLNIDMNNVNLIEVNEEIVSDISSRAFYYEVTELSTSIKPECISYLLSRHDKVVYLDPDIYVTSSFDEIYLELDKNNIVITPHSLSPIYDGKTPDDLNFLRAGSYNLGFIGVKLSDETERFVRWWSQRLMLNAFNAFSKGMFTDQKWIDLVPSYFDGVLIIKNEGYNVAYWNLHERKIDRSGSIYLSNNQPLIFFHFSGISSRSLLLSKYSNRYTDYYAVSLGISLIFSEYLEKLISNMDLLSQEYLKPYRYNVFSDGKKINDIHRMLYFYRYTNSQEIENPFLLSRSDFENNISDTLRDPVPRLFTSDDRIENLALKISKTPKIIKRIMRRIIVSEKLSRIIKTTNNAYNKINIAKLISSLYYE